jgi:hypothetical protein
MKKVLLILTLSCISFIVNAQPKKIKGYLYATGGANWATYFQSSKDVNSLRGIWGPEVALSLRTVYPTWVGYEAGVFYSTRGAQFSDTTGKVNINYAGIYGNALMFFPLINNDDMYAGMGVYAAGAINGTAGVDSLKRDVNFNEDWNRFDIGVQIRVGYVIKNTIGFGFHYDIGLVPPYTGVDLRGNTNHGRNSVFNLFLTVKLAKIFEMPAEKSY